MDTISKVNIYEKSTLSSVLSVTYYLELHNAKTRYCISFFFANKGQSGCLDIVKHKLLYLINKCTLIGKYIACVTPNSMWHSIQ